MSVSTSVARHYNRMRANLHHIPSILECKVRKLETALLSLRGGGEAESTQKADPQIKAVSSISAATAPASPRKWEPTPAADFHDSVNIGVLFVLGLGALYALFTSNETLHMLLTYVGFLYIALDLVWIAALPKIVKSPTAVISHHVATLLVLLDPLLEPKHYTYTSACLLVEINTLLLLLRRRMAYSPLVEVPFVLTWVLLRNIWYPLLMFFFVLCFQPSLIPLLPPLLADAASSVRSSVEHGAPVPMFGVSCLSWTAVCIFQFQWTFQLFGSHPWFCGKPKTKDGKYL